MLKYTNKGRNDHSKHWCSRPANPEQEGQSNTDADTHSDDPHSGQAVSGEWHYHIIARCTCQAVDKQIQRMSAKQQRHLPTAQLATETTPNQSKHQKRYVFFVVLIFFCGSSIVFLRITMFFIAHIYFNWLSLFFSGFVQFNLALKGF